MSETTKVDKDEAKNLRLVSQEGELYEVTIEVAKMSELVKTMIDGNDLFSQIIILLLTNINIDDQDEEDIQEIPLPNVKSLILARVIEFLEHHKLEPMSEIEKVMNVPFSYLGII